MYCRSCGSQLLVAAKFCADCGQTVQGPERVVPLTRDDREDYTTKVSRPLRHTEHAEAPPKRSSLPLALFVAIGACAGVVLALLAGFGLGTFTFLFTDNRKSSSPAEVDSPQTSKPSPTALPKATSDSPSFPPAPFPTQDIVASSEPVGPTVGNANVYYPAPYSPEYPPAIVKREVSPIYQVWQYRIKFPAGATGVVVRDSIAKLNRYYVLRARANQTMSVSLNSPFEGAMFNVNYDATGEPVTQWADARKAWTGVLPRSGDYQIIVDRGQAPAKPAMPIEMIVVIR